VEATGTTPTTGAGAPSNGGGGVELSVVIPVYGCRDSLDALHRRLTASLEQVGQNYEIVLVDDRSPDGSWATLEELAARDPHVRAFRLSRNFGQHAAITAGLAQSRGRYTVVMDCDLEEPPEEIPRLYAKAREGFEIVHTRRTGGERSALRGAAGRVYFRLRNAVLGTRTGTDHGTLSILSRKVVDAFLTLRDRDREYLIALDWLGFEHATIEFERAPRAEGRSSYSIARLLRVGLDGMFFHTTVLLRWIVLTGFAVALAGVALAAYWIWVYLTADPPSGFTSVAVLVVLLSGFIIVSIGVTGLYVGRIFEQVKSRPLFIVDATTTGEPPGALTDEVALERALAERAGEAARARHGQ